MNETANAEDPPHQRTVLFVIGPPAVGKMTVGAEIASRTGLKLFHNHRTIDLVLPYFAFGTQPFWRLVSEFRRRIFEEVADSNLPGLIFTYVWDFANPKEDISVEGQAEIFRSRGGRALFVELESTQAVRLERNETPFRLAEKPFKRDLEASRQQLLNLDANHQLNSAGRFDSRADWLRIENSALSPEQVATRVIEHFALPTVA